MIAAKNLGATRGELLRYATSGDVTGDKNAVVGYSSIVFV
jgi:AmmeMemoRadiSam system protein B